MWLNCKCQSNFNWKFVLIVYWSQKLVSFSVRDWTSLILNHILLLNRNKSTVDLLTLYHISSPVRSTCEGCRLPLGEHSVSWLRDGDGRHPPSLSPVEVHQIRDGSLFIFRLCMLFPFPSPLPPGEGSILCPPTAWEYHQREPFLLRTDTISTGHFDNS